MGYLQISQLGLRLLELGAQGEQLVCLLLELRLQSAVVTPRLLVGSDET